VHRKRNLWQSCLAYAKSQHVAARRGVDAWSCLRDGFLCSPVIPETRMNISDNIPQTPIEAREISRDHMLSSSMLQDEDPVAQVYVDVCSNLDNIIDVPSITAIDHLILSNRIIEETKGLEIQSKPLTVIQEEESLPFVNASPLVDDVMGKLPIIEENESENILSSSMQSLVDGLMTWGGQFDSEEDLNLPVGMATSIVMEGSGIASVN
jgi:hypothetical protein